MIQGLSKVTVITTLDDPRVDPYRSVRDADLRGRQHLCMVESEQVVRRLLTTRWDIHSLLLSPQKHERLAPLLRDRKVCVYIADITLMSKITGFHIHRGVLAAIHRPPPATRSIDSLINRLLGRTHISLLLAEGITNVDNMGSLFRNAAAFGVDALVFDHRCCDPLYRKAIRVSMGHTLSLPWAVTVDWKNELNLLKRKLGITLIGCETGEQAIPIWEVKKENLFGFIMGEEKTGLSPSTLEICDVIASIPMTPKVPSINVAVASAVCLYEFLGRDSFNKR